MTPTRPTHTGTPSDGVHVDGLDVRFPRAESFVLPRVAVDLGPGERCLVLGASGSGKSTLLQVLAGIVPRTIDADVDGQVGVAGLDPLATSVPLMAERVATLTQNPMDQLCLPTVLDEVAFACENRGVPREQIGDRVAQALDLVGGGHLLRRRTSELSGGEGQRVALAAALVADPDVLLLDEPTALRDPAGVHQVGRAISAGSHRRPGGGPARTSLLIEHRLDELPDLPEQVLVLGPDGAVHTRGATERVLVEEGASLAALGSNLPVRAELSVALGHTVGPGAEAVPDAIAALAGPGFGGASAPASTARASAPPGPTGVDEVVLRAEGLTVHRGSGPVASDVDLSARRGRVTAVVGANGSGKSSLLLGLAGLLPVSGALDGGSVGMVFQHPEHQFLTRTVRDEVGYGLGGRRADGIRPAVDGALGDFGLEGLADRDPFRLSGGQQRRPSLAAMAVLDHDVLLADEPTFGQDRQTTRAVAGVLQRLAGEGRAIVLVSHDLRLVGGIADDVLVLSDGQVAGHGPTAEVLADAPLLHRAGLRLPPLLSAWRGSRLPLQALLTELNERLAAAAPPRTATR